MQVPWELAGQTGAVAAYYEVWKGTPDMAEEPTDSGPAPAGRLTPMSRPILFLASTLPAKSAPDNRARWETTSRRILFLALVTVALLYAALVNVRTVVDTDIGWQLATGRYIGEQHRIPRRGIFSYTAAGQEWTYPPLSSLFFYGAYQLGGFSALTWVGVAACAGTVALLLAGGGIAGAALAVIGVPAVGFHTLPRANLFTPLLFAALLTLLWKHHREGHAALWLLPPLMVAWVNLHPGFVAGVALVGAYATGELLEMLIASRREQARKRLYRAAPWLAGSVAATLANPWGTRIHVTFTGQARILQSVQPVVSEWARVPLSLAGAGKALDWRSPWSDYWWLIALALLGAAVAARRQQVCAACLLSSAALVALSYVRFQALLAVVVIAVAGSVFDDRLEHPAPLTAQSPSRLRESPGGATRLRARLRAALSFLMLFLLLSLAGIRIADLVSNRYYLSEGEIAVFGTGATRWYPERACSFLLRERLPGRLFNNYAIGGYLVWRLGPAYPVYIDGRAIPFGPELVLRNNRLSFESPDSLEWQQEADRWGINTVMLGIARYGGVGPAIRSFCDSSGWRPVYLDEVSAVFVRNRPENAAWLRRLQIDCATVQFTAPASRNRAILYNFYADAGSVLLVLGRTGEALEAFGRARRLEPALYP